MRAAAILLLVTALSNATAQRPVQRRAPPAPQMPTGKGSIEGRAVNEITGEPVRKAQVVLNGPANLTAVTDASGHFAFRQLPAGQFYLQAQAAGFPASPHRSGVRRQIMLAADEQKADVVFSLVPGASISGRLVDEEGAPMAHCNVSAMQFGFTHGIKTLQIRNSANSDDKGEYRIANLSTGKYYVLARCPQSIPLPHAFIPRGLDVDAPYQTYAPVFYPGTPDLAGAARVPTTPGADVTDIDLRLNPAGGVTVRGHLTVADLEALPRNMQLTLEPRDPLRREWLGANPRFNNQSGIFSFQHVLPGAYEIMAATFGEGTPYCARIPIDVGSTAPEPLELRLAPALTLSGTVSLDGDVKAPFENMRVMLNPLEEHRFPSQPNAQVQKDGSFTLSGVVPGRWRLVVGGAGYVKSISLDQQQVTPSLVDVPAGFAGPLRIVIGTKWAQVEGTVSGAPPEAGQPVGLLWPAEAERQQSGLERAFNSDARGRFNLGGLPPGRYYACAVSIAEPWSLLQNAGLLNAIRSRCVTLELTEGGRTTAEVPFILARDLEQLVEDADN